MKQKTTYLILFLILIFSFITRVWQLNKNPAGFFCDEALRGVDALSILKTGRDSNGDFLPLFFKGFNHDGISSFNVYPIIPFIALFGLNEFSVRLIPVFWGIIEILLFYFLLKEIINNKFALIGTFLLSISPWHFHLNRISIADFYAWTLLTVISFLFLIKALKKKIKFSLFILSSLFFGFVTYSYYSARLITPLLFTLSITLVLSKNLWNKALLMISVYLVILVPFVIFHLTNPYSFQRVKDTVGIDIKDKQMSDLSQKESIIRFFNKYFLHYSDNFLFKYGDADFPGQFIRRHSIAGLGLLYPYQKWLVIAGLVWLIYKILFKKNFELLFVVFLLLTFPIADSLTIDKTPFATRSYLGVLPFHILIAFGIYAIYKALIKWGFWQKMIVKSVFYSLLCFLILNSFIILLDKHLKNPLTTSDFWGFQYGPREIISYFKEVEASYDELIMEPRFNAPHIFFKFYAPDSCKICLLGTLENLNPSKKQLFALSKEYLEEFPSLKFKTKKIIYYPDGSEAFRIIEVYN